MRQIKETRWRAYDKHQCEVEAEMERQVAGESVDASGAAPSLG